MRRIGGKMRSAAWWNEWDQVRRQANGHRASISETYRDLARAWMALMLAGIEVAVLGPQCVKHRKRTRH